MNFISNFRESVAKALTTESTDGRKFCKNCNQYLSANYQTNGDLCNCCAAVSHTIPGGYVITNWKLDNVAIDLPLPSKTINCPGCLKFVTRTITGGDTCEKCDCGQILCFGCGAPLTQSVPFWICNGSFMDCVYRSSKPLADDDIYA